MPRAGNRQKPFAELVDTRGQSSSDKDYLNVLRNEGPRKRGEPRTENNNRRAKILQ